VITSNFVGAERGDHGDIRRVAAASYQNSADPALVVVMGEFDFVGICEAPDDAVMAHYVRQLEDLGFVRTKTLKAFPETAYRGIIRSLG
jgi:uncharacterized protein with GYD domain